MAIRSISSRNPRSRFERNCGPRSRSLLDPVQAARLTVSAYNTGVVPVERRRNPSGRLPLIVVVLPSPCGRHWRVQWFIQLVRRPIDSMSTPPRQVIYDEVFGPGLDAIKVRQSMQRGLDRYEVLAIFEAEEFLGDRYLFDQVFHRRVIEHNELPATLIPVDVENPACLQRPLMRR